MGGGGLKAFTEYVKKTVKNKNNECDPQQEQLSVNNWLIIMLYHVILNFFTGHISNNYKSFTDNFRR